MRAGTVAGVALLALGTALAALSLPTVARQGAAVATYEDVAREVSGAGDAPSPEEGGGVDWAMLLGDAPDVVAWCRVDGTSIDLPVCQGHDDDPGYWLTHDAWRGESPAGAPYVDHRADAGSAHVLCYGHNLAGTGGMFSDLHRCCEQGEFDRRLTGELVWATPDGDVVRLSPLCARSADQDWPDIQAFGFEGADGLRAWLSGIVASSSARSPRAGEVAAGATRAITLVTCGSDLPGRRERTVVTFAG